MVGTLVREQQVPSPFRMAKFSLWYPLAHKAFCTSRVTQGPLSRTNGLQPSVGIWISGILSLQDAHLWAAGMAFLLSRASIEKALQPDMAFLVVVFMPGNILSRFYLACQEHSV